jgi:hypothetical protein
MTDYKLETKDQFMDFAKRLNPKAITAVEKFYSLVPNPKALDSLNSEGACWKDLGRVYGLINASGLENDIQLTLEATGLGHDGIDLSLEVKYPKENSFNPNSYQNVKYCSVLSCKTSDATGNYSFGSSESENKTFDSFLNVINNIFSSIDYEYIRE